MKQAKKWNLEPSDAKQKLPVDWSDTWLVLRCSNGNTVALVAALVGLGVRAWTPMWVRRRRFPRSSVSRELLLPCLPSFVFLAAPDAMKALAAKQGSGVPGFSVMNSYGVLVRIKDSELEGLRKVGDINPRRANPVVWPAVGSVKRVTSGAFQGMIGEVVGMSDRHCLVDFKTGFFPVVKIPPFLLSDVEA